jgi:uncharacterized OB-fold protein
MLYGGFNMFKPSISHVFPMYFSALMDPPALKHRQDIALGVAALEHPGWIVLYTWSVSQFYLPHGLEEGALVEPTWRNLASGGETANCGKANCC